MAIQTFHQMVIAKKGGSTVTFLVDEGFEGTGVPSGWSDNGSTPDFDYSTSPAPLAGTQSLFLASGTNCKAPLFSNSELWFKFMWRISAIPGSNQPILSIFDTGFGQSFAVAVKSDGTLEAANGANVVATASSVSANTTYFIWLHQSKGTGADAVYEVAFNTVDTYPGGGNVASASNGTNTNDIVHCFPIGSTGGDAIFDNFQVADSAFQ